MHISNKYYNYYLAAQLARRIIAPSNQTGESETTPLSQNFDPDRSHPVYTTNLSTPEIADAYKNLDDL